MTPTTDAVPTSSASLPPALAFQEARRAGYTDTDIIDHLSADPRWSARSSQFAEAQKAGYTPTEIVNHLATPDLTRIKRNVASMITQGAPDSDVDQYVASEGVTAEQLRAHKEDT